LIPPSSTPEIQQPQVIGSSVAGRPLEVYQFGIGPVEKMIVAGIHGGYEWNTIALADELIDYLNNYPEVVPLDQTLYILRALNPDGLARSEGFGGRANENNVDINRNFPSNWQADWPRHGCWDYIPITGGKAAASEPETRALMSFIQTHDIQALISYHSAALGIFPGGQPPDAGSLSLAEALAAVSDYPYPPIEAGCVYTGQFVDWVSDQGIPGVDIELTNHQDSDFAINLAILSVFLDWSYSE
jgi:predicted deacylase